MCSRQACGRGTVQDHLQRSTYIYKTGAGVFVDGTKGYWYKLLKILEKIVFISGGRGFELPVPRAKICRQPPASQHREKGPNVSFITARVSCRTIDANLSRRSADAARKRSSRIAGTKLLPRWPVLCAKCRLHGANLTRRAEWF